MLILYIYLFILLSMATLALRGINNSISFVPVKIKVLSIIVFAAILFRTIGLFIMFFSQNIIFLYLLKPSIFLNLLYIPVIAGICIFIFIRNDKINFYYFIAISFVLFLVYIFVVYKVPAVIESLPSYGYSMSIWGNPFVLYGFIGLNTAALVFCVTQLGKPIVNNFGLFLILLCSAVCIADVFLSALDINYLTQNILGEFLFVGTINYALERLKK
jgi:hypothetical protein